MKRFFALFAALLIPSFAVAQDPNDTGPTQITIRGAGDRLIPIALPQLCAQSGESPAVRDIPRIIARDLDLSGYFEVQSPESYIENSGRCLGADTGSYSDWTVIGSEGLVRGIVQSSGGKVKIQLYLHDVPKQQMVLGKEYEADSSNITKIAHRFANEIMRYFTGEYGPFGTQIAYSSKVGRFKELFLMDMDGSNIRQLTNDKSLAVSASWDSRGTRLLYTTYRLRVPDIFMLDVASRRSKQITNDGAMELGPKFTQSEGGILGSREVDGDSDIVTFDMEGKVVSRLTRGNRAIDVSADWSPDYSRIVFCSNRGGGPQIYTMNADGSNPQRVSFVSSNYCTSPSWSPKGDRIAFVCRADGGFQIYVSNPDGSAPLQLTAGGDNEDPDWSPDGRYLVFSSTGGNRNNPFRLSLVRADGGSAIRQLTNGRIGDSQPSWGPYEQ